ncbi:MAG TPA: outer membrane protein transport protein [Rhizomicrobium sp.]|jgi:long-chain fatty acid transport protein
MRRVILAFVFVAGPATSALAAAYAVREQSADAMSTAYAGAAATGTDASFLNYNPAAAAATDGGDIAFSAIAILPNSSANESTALTSAGTPVSGTKTASGFIRNAVVPNVAMRQRLSDRWSVGLSVSVPWGLSTYYPSSYAGRYYGLGTKLLTVNVSPVVAYDIAPGISLAGGLQAQYAKGTLTSDIDTGTLGATLAIPGSVPGAMDTIARVNTHNWAYGYVLGARASLDDGWTLGLSYHSAVHHTLKGPLTFTLDGAGLGAAIRGATGLFTDTTARAKLATPDVAEFGVRKKINDRLTALLEVDWTGWSVFKELRVVAANPVQPSDVTNAQWHDSWMAALGVEYVLDDQWTLRGGTAYDGSPIPDSTISPRIPDADRYWISAGATYHASQSTDLKLTYSHLFNDTRDMAQSPTQPGNALRGVLTGTTESGVNVVGLQIDYRWQ